MGVRSQTRAILKMTNCTFAYPGQSKPQLFNVSAAVSLSSRVGIGELSSHMTVVMNDHD
jgi:elongation factor 3